VPREVPKRFQAWPVRGNQGKGEVRGHLPRSECKWQCRRNCGAAKGATARGVGWGCWGLRPLLGGLVRGVLALRAVAFGEAAAQDTAEDGEADAADQIEDAGGEASR